jgi:hypothetical protein
VLLKNSYAPYWKAWRTDSAGWARRCLERLSSSDHDYWALAALLGLRIEQVREVLEPSGYTLESVRWAQARNDAKLHLATFRREGGGDDHLWSGVLELGWDSKSGTLTDVARWRAVAFDELSREGGNALGRGHGTLFLRAALPYGTCRAETGPFELLREWAVPVEKSLLRGGNAAPMARSSSAAARAPLQSSQLRVPLLGLKPDRAHQR